MHWSFAWKMASRFIAGEKLEDAIRVIKELNDKGINATLDMLGEHTTNAEEARQATRDILKMFDAINAAGVRSNVSIKLTQIGLRLDPELCAENLQVILNHARSCGSFVRIDMEEATCVDTTLDMYRRMVDDCCLDNTGVVIQSYLYRSEQDVRNIVARGGRIRLCKGAYKEAADVAFPQKPDVDANYDKLAEIMIDAAAEHGAPQLTDDGRVPPIPAIASHDPKRLEHAKAYAAKAGLPKGAIEFQMLHGIRRDLQEQYAREGYPVRIYVPFGTQWYPYYMRRLAERPANVWFFISNYFRK
jgi:proline dehydrogenase